MTATTRPTTVAGAVAGRLVREPTTTVLVVEDEESFVEALTVGLKREGFRVEVARDGANALDRFDAVHPDLVLLDVMLPTMSGIEVCRQIRTVSSVPIIMVSAKTSEIDVVVGLEVGADDYVSKPYRMRELVARIRATLRRSPHPEPSTVLGVVEVGHVRLDPERHEVFVSNRPIKLTLKEFALLETLLRGAGRVMTRDTLIDQVWGPAYVGDTKTLDVHIKRLRAKVELDPASPSSIVTIRGLGYKFESPGRSGVSA
jgi:two-component system response regulator RegX3